MHSRRQLVSFATPDNPLGVAALAAAPPPNPASSSASSGSRSAPCFLFLPSSSDSGDLASYDLRSLEVVGLVAAHEAAVACAVASPDGQMLATASSRGTIVRVHAVPRGGRLASFRRGSRPTSLRSLAWLSPPATTDRPTVVGDAPIILAAASDSNTVHIFAKGLERASASAAMASAAGGFVSSMARGLFSGTRPADQAAPRAAGDLQDAPGSGAPPRAAPVGSAGDGVGAASTSAPSALPAAELAQAASRGHGSSRGSGSGGGGGSSGRGPSDGARAQGSRSSADGSFDAAVGLDLALARADGSSAAARRSSQPSFSAAMSEAMYAGLKLGGVEGERSFAHLRRAGVDGREVAPVAAMSLRWVAADDWACGIDADPKGHPRLEAVLVVESGAVLRFAVDGTSGGEGSLVGEGRVTVDDEDEEQGVRGGTGQGHGGGLDAFYGRAPTAEVVPPPEDCPAAPAGGPAAAVGVLSSNAEAGPGVVAPVPAAASTRRRSSASSAGAPSSASSARNRGSSAPSAGGDSP